MTELAELLADVLDELLETVPEEPLETVLLLLVEAVLDEDETAPELLVTPVRPLGRAFEVVLLVPVIPVLPRCP